MKVRPLLMIVGAIGLVVVVAVGWYLGSPLFINRSVEEDFPAGLPGPEELASMSEQEKMEVRDDVMSAAAEAPGKEMADSMPEGASEASLLLQGEFVDADSFHQGSGTASIYALEDGSRVLRFENLDVTNGPDLHVFLAASSQPTGRSDLGEHLDLGPLKGNQGNQNYAIPDDVDLDTFHSVIIYCVPFHVLFSYASLSN